MASPFPGMDPYLEQATLWPEFHSRLIVALADVLAPSLLPKYFATQILCGSENPHLFRRRRTSI